MEDNQPEKKDNVQPADNSGDGAFESASIGPDSGSGPCQMLDCLDHPCQLVSLGTVTLQPSNDYVP